MRRAWVLVVAGLLGTAISGFDAAPAQTPQCSKADFEAVVDEAAGALRDLARQNTPQFQGKLRQLKGKRGWSDDQLVKEAEPLVRDDKIAGFDQQSEEFLAAHHQRRPGRLFGWRAGLQAARRAARRHAIPGRDAEGQMGLHVREDRGRAAQVKGCQ